MKPSKASPFVEKRIREAASEFFARAKSVSDISLDNFSESVEFSKTTIHTVFTEDSWIKLKQEWLSRRLLAALEEAHSNARRFSDFDAINIYKNVGVHYKVFKALVGEEWRKHKATLSQSIFKNLQKDVESFFNQAKTLEDISKRKFYDYVELSEVTFTKIFPEGYWSELQEQWIYSRLHNAMIELYWNSRTKKDFSEEKITVAAGFSGIRRQFRRLIHSEFLLLKSTLPDVGLLLLETMQRMVSSNIPIDQFNWQRICATANVEYKTSYQGRADLIEAFRRGYLQLFKGQGLDSSNGKNISIRTVNAIQVELSNTYQYLSKASKLRIEQDESDYRQKTIQPEIKTFPGEHAVDLNSEIWNLGFAGGKTLKREQLRADFRNIVWWFLRDELRSQKKSASTIGSYYQGFIILKKALDGIVPDIYYASLTDVQSVWVSYKGTDSQRICLRTALKQIFTLLYYHVENDSELNQQEILKILIWIENSVSIKTPDIDNDSLNETEVDSITECCLKDINEGIEFANHNTNLLGFSTKHNVKHNAVPIVYWGVALLILVMIFTGLRCQSAVFLEVEDFVQVEREVYAVRWKHDKIGEHQVGSLDPSIANHLHLYIQVTEQIRQHLNTKQIFVAGNGIGIWSSLPKNLSKRFDIFVKRHGLLRDGKPLPISTNLLRRTFATRAAYQGIPLLSISQQLGHETLTTTIQRYIKLNQHEHPKIVGAALDTFARQSLRLWEKPILLETLSPNEREGLLNTWTKRYQEVGLCRNESCTMAVNGNPPPCSLCRFLVTGKEFLKFWKMEHTYRLKQIEDLSVHSGNDAIVSQLKHLLKEFEENYLYVEQSSI